MELHTAIWVCVTVCHEQQQRDIEDKLSNVASIKFLNWFGTELKFVYNSLQWTTARCDMQD